MDLVPAGARHHVLLPAQLRDVQVGDVVELVLVNRLMPQRIIIMVAAPVQARLHAGLVAVVVVVVVLVADADLLVVVPVRRLALLVPDYRHAVDAWDAALLTVDYLTVIIKQPTILMLQHIKILPRPQVIVELVLRVERVQVLEVDRVEGVLE